MSRPPLDRTPNSPATAACESRAAGTAPTSTPSSGLACSATSAWSWTATPMVVPTVYGCDAHTIYFHGSVASRSLVAAPQAVVCLTITHLDSLVLARSVFEHGVNYRSAMIYGVPRAVTDPEEKRAGLRCRTEHIAPATGATPAVPAAGNSPPPSCWRCP